MGVMKNIRVVEVADYVFVPAASAILADWGAEVVKIEHHERGDALRGLFLPEVGMGEVNIHFESANRGKKSIGIDLNRLEGRQLLYRLIAAADVFITNKLPSVRERLGLNVEDLRAYNPSLIYARGTSVGNRGAEADKGGFDVTSFWHRTGASLIAKDPEVERPPSQPGPAFGDLIGAMTLAGGIAAALLQREREGIAPTVDVSLLGTGLWAQSIVLAATMSSGEQLRHLVQNAANATNALACNYQTKDGRWLMLACLQGHRYWRSACRLFGREDLVTDTRFATAEDFFGNAREAAGIIAEVIGSETLEYWKEQLADFDGQWVVVQNSVEVPEDSEVLANCYIADSVASNGAPLRLVTTPVQFDEKEIPPRRAPLFNEHCEEILGNVGYGVEDVLGLRIQGIVA